MDTHIEGREDVSPKEGLREYGDVEFADPTNRKYPAARLQQRKRPTRHDSAVSMYLSLARPHQLNCAD